MLAVQTLTWVKSVHNDVLPSFDTAVIAILVMQKHLNVVEMNDIVKLN